MLSGQQTLGEIETAIGNLHGQERSLQAELERANTERMKLFEQRTAAYRELATVRARSAVADGVIDAADRLGHRVEAMLQARQTTIDALKERARAALTRRDGLIAETETLRAETEAFEKRLDAAAVEARAALEGEAAYVALRTQRDAARSVFEKANEKTRRAEADRVTKGRAYESDALFMYLWSRGYRSADYRPSYLVRWADDQVAALVGYNEARANYAILQEIPTRLRAHTDDLGRDLATAQAGLDAAEGARIRAIAGTDLVATIDAARTRRSSLNTQIEAVEAELGDINAQLNRYAEGLDESFQKAVAVSAEFLEQESYERLVGLARATVAPTDDEIVSRIGVIDGRIGGLKSEIETRRGELETIAKRRAELMQIAADFRRSHYDEPGSVFTSNDIAGALLEALIRGTLSRDGYWDHVRRGQTWRGRPADPFRRDNGWPPFGGGWTGGSWGGGNWDFDWGGSGGSSSGGGGSRSSGGGGGGDDFRTGGGF